MVFFLSGPAGLAYGSKSVTFNSPIEIPCKLLPGVILSGPSPIQMGDLVAYGAIVVGGPDQILVSFALVDNSLAFVNASQGAAVVQPAIDIPFVAPLTSGDHSIVFQGQSLTRPGLVCEPMSFEQEVF
jgi:hypothetical protein